MTRTSSARLAEALADAVRERGAATVFGLPGGGPNLDVVGATEAAGLRFVLAHGETAAAIMAGTYGLLTGRPTMTLATRGPGAASVANGAAQATLDRYPLLLVTDCVAEADQAAVAHQRLDQRALLGAVTKWSTRLSLDGNAPWMVRAALDLAVARPAGAVHLDYDPDGAADTIELPLVRHSTSVHALLRAKALVAGASRPVVIAGFDAVSDAPAVRAALEEFGAPVLVTYQASGLLPEGHPLLAGLYTNGAIERALLSAADLVVTVGLDEVEPMPGGWRYGDVPVIVLEAAERVASHLPASIEVTGPLSTSLAQLATAAASSTWPEDAGAQVLSAARSVLAATATPGRFGPLELVQALVEAAPADAVVTVDAGAHFLAVLPFWPVRAPLDLLISNGLATMGFALPAAIGAALARPGRPVVCCVGDGGLAMTLAELETLARLRLPVTVVVFDDAALSLIEVKQRDGQGGAGAVRFGPVDYAAIARACGLQSVIATTAADVSRALHGGWDGPRLVDARIDPSTYAALIKATRG